MTHKLYIVGGYVRDKLLGIQSKDIDYVAVVDGTKDIPEAFDYLKSALKSDGLVIFMEKPETYTLRCKYPKDHPVYPNEYADFTLATKNGQVGTLEDDLYRRDFTINAMALDPETGEIHDPYFGQPDVFSRQLNSVQREIFTFHDDPIRILRAVRFDANGFRMSYGISECIRNLPDNFLSTVSPSRIVNELGKMCKDPVVFIEAMSKLMDLNPRLCVRLFDYVKIRASQVKNKKESDDDNS